jgi:hypothetical protein
MDNTYVVVFVILYFLFNIIGTYYWVKLKQRGVSGDTRVLALVTVFIGWLGFPIINITSPLIYQYHT